MTNETEMIDETETLDSDAVELAPEDQAALEAEAIIAGESTDEDMELAEEEAAADSEKNLEDFIEPSEMSQLDFSDVEDDVNCSVDLETRKRVVEAVLFVSDKPVGLTTFTAAFSEDEVVKKTHIREALEAFEEDLEEHNRGFRLHQVDGGYQLRTAGDLKEYLQNTIKARSFRLTGPSLETLAMVAYKQPCPKSSIDEIRGVDSSHLIRALMDRNLLAFAGKSELPGKPMLYKTTSKFLEVFGLRSIKELPSLSEIEALLPNGIGDEEEEKETLSDLAGKLGEDFEGSYSASEEELGKINDQLSTISTETEFFEQEKQREKERKELEKAENIREALMVGEEVSTRDQNWLVRFDEKMAAQEEGSNSENLEASKDDLSEEALEEAEVLADLEAAEAEDLEEGVPAELSEEARVEAEERAAEAVIMQASDETAEPNQNEPFEDFLEGAESKEEDVTAFADELVVETPDEPVV